MKQFFTLALAMGTAFLSTAQITSLSVETVVEHDGSVEGLEGLAGYTTYRVYAEMTSSNDFLSAAFGDAANPMMIGCDGTIFQQGDVGFNYANDVNTLFFGVYPDAEFDSWFTIGAEDANGGVNIQNTADTMAPALALFNAGQGFVINDPIGASWFNVFPCLAGQDIAECAAGSPAFGGDDSKVLVAQITANGDIYGLMNFQVFAGGVQQDEGSQQVGLTFSSDAMDVFGCTDDMASNFNMMATVDDLSCIFPCTVELNLENISTPSCNGENDAVIQTFATGAQGADYYYIDSIGGVGQNFGNFGNLVAGMYNIIVEDAAGCTDSLDVEVPVTGVVEIDVELTSPVSCNGESDAVLSVTNTTGGSGMYEYYISTDPTVLTTQTEWTGLSGGLNPSVYAIDSNGCIGQSESVMIQDPQAVVVDLLAPTGTVDASCANVADGEIYLVAFGGNAPQTIEYSVDGVTFGPSPLMVSGGTYTVTAMDVYGCTGTVENEVVIGPDAIAVNALGEPESCFGENDGMVSWAPVGGQGAYSFTFGGNATTESAVLDLMPGEYEVSVTDEDMCTETVMVVVEAAAEIVTSTSVLDVLCAGENDGEVTVSAEGGTGSFQFSDDGNNFSGNNVFDDLLAGDYTFFVQDENGCSAGADATVAEGGAISITGIVSEGDVTGEGSIDITVTGGTPPYEYEWIGPEVSGTTDADLEGISSGTYIVEVTDDNGCSNSESFNLTTDVQEIAAGLTASIFPNPSQGLFVVDIAGSMQNLSIPYQVVDAGGRVLLEDQWNVGAGSFRTTLDLTSAEAGMYRLVMMANGRPTSVQIVKMH